MEYLNKFDDSVIMRRVCPLIISVSEPRFCSSAIILLRYYRVDVISSTFSLRWFFDSSRFVKNWWLDVHSERKLFLNNIKINNPDNYETLFVVVNAAVTSDGSCNLGLSGQRQGPVNLTFQDQNVHCLLYCNRMVRKLAANEKMSCLSFQEPQSWDKRKFFKTALFQSWRDKLRHGIPPNWPQWGCLWGD